MNRIATLTLNPAIDMGTRTPRVVPEWKLRCQEPWREPGGGGINVSRATRKLGGSSATVYLAGGPTGDILEELLREEGLDPRVVATKGWTRENMHVFEEVSEQEYRFNMPGQVISVDELHSCLELIDNLEPAPDYLVVSGSLPPGFPPASFALLAEEAERIGARLVADTSGEALRSVVEKGVYLIKPNLRELRDLVGRELADEVEQEEALQRLVEEGACEVIVLSLGSAGAWVVSRDVSEHIRSPSVPIRSRIGAGDSMVAGLTLGLSRGLDLVSAVRFGVAAGAAAVMTEGTELCGREDTERLYVQMGGSL